MAGKAIWMVILLCALLALSVSAVFAANATRPAQAVHTPEISVSHFEASPGAVKGYSTFTHDRGDCPYSQADGASAY